MKCSERSVLFHTHLLHSLEGKERCFFKRCAAAAAFFALSSNAFAAFSAFAALLSNLVSNVPAVLVFKGFVPHLPDPAHAWLTLAMSSTLAGNLTILGSVANLIVVERARRQVRIGFWEYARAGVPLSVRTAVVRNLDAAPYPTRPIVPLRILCFRKYL